jgi:hypothetical protein
VSVGLCASLAARLRSDTDGPGSLAAPAFLLPLFTNVLEEVFSEVGEENVGVNVAPLE